MLLEVCLLPVTITGGGGSLWAQFKGIVGQQNMMNPISQDGNNEEDE